MAHLVTPSPSLRSAGAINSTVDDNDDLRKFHDDEIVAKNRMIILELEEKYMLPQGMLSIAPSGELQADLSHEEPDQGTMKGRYPTLPYELQIPSWLRDYLIQELNLFGTGPPYGFSSFYDQMMNSQEIDREGTNLTVKSATLFLSYGIMGLRDELDRLREFCSLGEVAYEDNYATEFGIVEGTVKRLAGWAASQSVQNRLLATRPTDDKSDKQSPAKRRKISKDSLVGVAHGATVSSSSCELPRDIQLLLELGSQGKIMKGVLDSSLEETIITPVSQLVEKLDIVYKGLRQQEKDEKKKEEHHVGGDHSSDSGVSACSP